mgnify:CR=1 FL=1
MDKCETCQCYYCFENWLFNQGSGNCSHCYDCDDYYGYILDCIGYDDEDNH